MFFFIFFDDICYSFSFGFCFCYSFSFCFCYGFSFGFCYSFGFSFSFGFFCILRLCIVLFSWFYKNIFLREVGELGIFNI